MTTSQEERIAEFRTNDEWLLIIFDALRYDTFDHYQRNAEVEKVISPATRTDDWMERVWGGEYNACYVSGAPLTGNHDHSKYNGDNHFEEMVELWKNNWSKELRTVPPKPITDAATNALEEYDMVLVHYIQPHAPYIGTPRIIGERGRADTPLADDEHGDIGVMREIRQSHASGELSDEDLQRAYYDNLVQVAESARPLIEASDRPTAITSDHGECLGEHIIGHDHNCPHVRQVPWCEIQ